jgi:hypothetical protein
VPITSVAQIINVPSMLIADVTTPGGWARHVSKYTNAFGQGDIRRCRWKDLDFTGSELSGIRLFDCEIQNCRFDACQFEDLRVWSSSFSDTSFRGARLRRAVLGGVQDGRRNIFSKVDFNNADLRQSIYTAAAFEHCIIKKTQLVKIDFQTSTFSDCTFEGELRVIGPGISEPGGMLVFGRI